MPGSAQNKLSTTMQLQKHPPRVNRGEFLFTVYLGLLILAGVASRFLWVNWSQGANLHPDEYGLTNTLTQLALPENLDGYFNTRLSPLSPYQRYDASGQVIANGPDNGMRWGQWPIILIRFAAQASGNTGYDELRLMGRTLSAFADALSLLLIYLTGQAPVQFQNRAAGSRIERSGGDADPAVALYDRG